MTVVQAVGSGLSHRCGGLHAVHPCRPYLVSRTTLVLQRQSSSRSLCSHACRSIPYGNIADTQQRHAVRRRSFGPNRCRPTAEAISQSSSASVYKEEKRPSNVYVALSILAVVVCALANRVLYKMALVPLGNYVFFLAQLQTFGYVAVYFTVLYWRYRKGIVTQQMLDTPKKQFLLIGALEAASSILGFIGAAKLPGVALPLLQQSMMFWQIGLGYLLLGKKLAPIQFAGAAVVTAGVCTAAWPSAGQGLVTQVDPLYAGVFVASMFFPALATIFKERIFAASKEQLKGQSLDIFVVNSFGSAAQALFVFLSLPVMLSLRGMPLSSLPAYIKEGTTCLMGGSPSAGSNCAGAPKLAFLYILFNLTFNVAALNLLKTAGNVVQTLVMSSIVPLSIFAFTLSLPYLPPAPPLGPNFWVGTAVLVVGLLTFNSPQWRPMLQKKLQSKAA